MSDVIYRHMHTFPVDDSFLEGASTLDDFTNATLEAWKEICNFGRRVTFTGGEHWGNVKCDGLECWRIVDESTTMQDL